MQDFYSAVVQAISCNEVMTKLCRLLYNILPPPRRSITVPTVTTNEAKDFAFLSESRHSLTFLETMIVERAIGDKIPDLPRLTALSEVVSFEQGPPLASVGKL